METKAPVFFVSEIEYPKLQAACPEDFPFTYAEFVARVEAGTQEMAGTVALVKVWVVVAEFLMWCKTSKLIPNNTARAQYAAVQFLKQGFH